VATARVPGVFNRQEEAASLRLKPREEFYQTAVHELMHALAHPAFRTAFGDEDNINEGFTEYFTQSRSSAAFSPRIRRSITNFQIMPIPIATTRRPEFQVGTPAEFFAEVPTRNVSESEEKKFAGKLLSLQTTFTSSASSRTSSVPDYSACSHRLASPVTG
jgi:hypothetical protein